MPWTCLWLLESSLNINEFFVLSTCCIPSPRKRTEGITNKFKGKPLKMSSSIVRQQIHESQQINKAVCMCVAHVCTHPPHRHMNMMLVDVNYHLSLTSTVLCEKVMTGHLLQLKLVIWRQPPIPVSWLCSINLRSEWIANGGLELHHISY